MKKLTNLASMSFLSTPLFSFLLLLLLFAGCRRKDTAVPLHNYEQVNLVADIDDEEYPALRLDATLVNPWGIAVAPTGPIWIASEGTGKSQVYDKMGNQLIPPVDVPGPDVHIPGHPTGIVFNPSTTDFALPGTTTISRFIFAGVDGIISAWAPGSIAAVLIANNSATSVYTGLTMASNGKANYLYAANFRTGKIDVWDKDFKWVSKPFVDPHLPSDYSPFNVRALNGLIYVAYAKVDPTTHEEAVGVGNGILNVFTPDGILIKRFASHGMLNAPWGLAASRTGFTAIAGAILVGNFGDGRINVFDALGTFQGQLMSKGQPISIEGLWSLESNVPNADAGQIYFTAGVDDEEHGLFGYIMKK